MRFKRVRRSALEHAVSIRSQLLHLAIRLADVVGGEPRLDAAEIIASARRRAGLDDFGPWDIAAPLRLLLACYDEEARLNLFGRMGARWDMGRLLGNLLRLRAEEAADPAILDQTIAAPVFITGLPRSGSTFLHALLTEDPAHSAPRCWQTIRPYPGPDGAEAAGRDVDRQLRLFDQLAPGFRDFHPIDATSPQECTEITAHVLQSLRFDMTHHVPSYRHWLDRVGHRQAYRFHRRFLQHLQHQAGTAGHWVLKSPDHVFALDALRAVYPDARIVMLHRDPVRVLGSVARLTEILRAPFTREVDRAQIGRQIATHWAIGAASMMHADAGGAVLHLHHRALIADPIGTVRRLYAALGRELSPQAAARMQSLVESRPNGGYGQNRYRLTDYGLDAGEQRARFAAYAAHFDVEPEEPAD